MLKPKNVWVSLYDDGKGEIKVWNISFTIKGSLNRKDGKVPEEEIQKKQQQIRRLIEQLTLPED